MHVPCPLFDRELRCFVFVLQYNFKKPFNSDMNDNKGLQSIMVFFIYLFFVLHICSMISDHKLAGLHVMTTALTDPQWLLTPDWSDVIQ